MNSDEIIKRIKEISFTDNDSIITSLREGYTSENKEKNNELKDLFLKLNSFLVTQKQVEREQFAITGEVLGSLATFICDAEWIQELHYDLSDIIYKGIYNTQL